MKLPLTDAIRANQTILFLCVATALLMTGQGIAGPILPLYAQTLHVTTAQIGLVISAFGLARFLTNMPAAILSDRWGRRALLVGGPFISAIGNLLVITSSDLWTLLIYRFIAGIGSAAFITGAVVFISDITASQNRGRVLSLYQGAFTLGITLGPAMGGLIAEAYGLHAPFLAIAATSLASGIWALARMPETRWHKSAEGTASRADPNSAGAQDAKPKRGMAAYAFLLTPSFLIICLAFMGTFFTRGGAQFMLQPLKAADDLHLSPGQIGLLFSIPSVLNFGAIFLVGYLSDRYGRKRIIVPGMLLSGVGLALTGLWDSVWPFAIGMALGGVAQALAGSPAVAYVADISPSGRQAVAQGMARSVGDFSLLVAPPLMGFAADAFGVGPTLVANAVALLAIGVFIHFFADDPYARTLQSKSTTPRKPA